MAVKQAFSSMAPEGMAPHPPGSMAEKPAVGSMFNALQLHACEMWLAVANNAQTASCTQPGLLVAAL